uniref:Uncharacterized protein n=1 Tax=Trichobilharzia regenti TaxID=157069 RepID=A0AA85K6I9_TRIRE|nr:unnamed protein product [Trichobilharzia regenti]
MHDKHAQNNDNTNNKDFKLPLVLLCKGGTLETFWRILNNAGIKVSFRLTYSLRNKLWQLKDSVAPVEQNNLVYLIPCYNDCQVKYIGQTSRTAAVS